MTPEEIRAYAYVLMHGTPVPTELPEIDRIFSRDGTPADYRFARSFLDTILAERGIDPAKEGWVWEDESGFDCIGYIRPETGEHSRKPMAAFSRTSWRMLLPWRERTPEDCRKLAELRRSGPKQ
jgi:hypothetical protein